jgi:predicted nucleic acid-binding protein
VGAIVLDSSLIIGFFMPDDPHHDQASAEIADARRGGADFILPISVLSEVMVGAYRSGAARERHSGMLQLFGPPRSFDEELALAAAELRSRHRALRLPDALVVATGIIEDAEVLTCEKRLATVDERVRVIGAG